MLLANAPATSWTVVLRRRPVLFLSWEMHHGCFSWAPRRGVSFCAGIRRFRKVRGPLLWRRLRVQDDRRQRQRSNVHDVGKLLSAAQQQRGSGLSRVNDVSELRVQGQRRGAHDDCRATHLFRPELPTRGEPWSSPRRRKRPISRKTATPTATAMWTAGIFWCGSDSLRGPRARAPRRLFPSRRPCGAPSPARVRRGGARDGDERSERRRSD
jgi:hypothetical protein